MSADRHEGQIRESERELERTGDELEHHIDQLGEHIDEAKGHAKPHPDLKDNDIAGDWENESAGAQQGDDPEDAGEHSP